MADPNHTNLTKNNYKEKTSTTTTGSGEYSNVFYLITTLTHIFFIFKLFGPEQTAVPG